MRENATVTYAGRLELGEGNIESRLATDAEVEEKLELGRECLRAVEDRKCAVCIDGRCGCCTAKDVIDIKDGLVQFEAKKPKIRPKVPGGLYFYVTVAAIGADLEIVRGAQSFDEAKAHIAAKLDAEGYHDGAHTTVLSYADPAKTECGAQDGIGGSTEAAVRLDEESAASGEANGLDHAVAALNGRDKEFFRGSSTYKKVRETVRSRQKDGFYTAYDSRKSRDEMAEHDPDALELLESDASHPTRLHEEDLLIVNTIPGFTVDRDEFKARSGRGAFVLDVWMLNEDIAPLITSSDEEAEALRISGDYATAFVANKLVAKGLPVGVISVT